jgi:hypothetical protein
MVKRGKKAQLTMFIILAILIVAIVIFIILFWPKLKSDTGPEIDNPYIYIQECMEEKIDDTINTLSTQGGVIENTASYVYEGENIEYLCYTNKNYQPCVVQKPLLVSSFEQEFHDEIEEETIQCFGSLENNYKAKGFDVDLEKGNTVVDFEEGALVIDFNASLTLTKVNTEEYKKFVIRMPTNLYEMLKISNAIVELERDYGKAPTDMFIDLYGYKIQNLKQIDGTTIYIIEDREEDGDAFFQFAVRSVVRPPEIAP